MRIDLKKTWRIKLLFIALLSSATPICSAHAQTTPPTPPPSIMCNPALATSDAHTNPYMGASMDPGTIFDHVQFPELTGNGVLGYTNDNRMNSTNGSSTISAPDVTPCPNAPWKDQVLTYAAYKFCEEATRLPPPPPSTIPSSSTAAASLGVLGRLQEYTDLIRQSALVYHACIKQVRYRISEPKIVMSANPSDPAGQNAYALQVRLCHLLKDPLANLGPNGSATQVNNADNATTTPIDSSIPGAGTALPGGTSTSNFSQNINTTGHPEIDGALLDCDPDDTGNSGPGGTSNPPPNGCTDPGCGGLSLEAAKAAWAHRCSDPNYVIGMGGDYKGSDLARAHEACVHEGTAYDEHVEQQENDLMHAIMQLKQLQNTSQQNKPSS